MKTNINLLIDKWWKAVFILGTIAAGSSLYLKISFIDPGQLFGLGLSLIMVGTAYWMAEKDLSQFKPANAYTGPAGFISWKEIKHNGATVIILALGTFLTMIFGFLIIRGLF